MSQAKVLESKINQSSSKPKRAKQALIAEQEIITKKD